MRTIPLVRSDIGVEVEPEQPEGLGRSEEARDAPPPSDAALVAEIRAGSAAGLQELMNRFWAPLVRYAARDFGDVELARDIVQETFIQVWERRRSLTAAASVRAYLYRTVRSQVIDEQRRRRVRRDWSLRERGRPAARPPTPAEVLAEEEILNAYRRAVAALPDRRREVFNLVFVSGLSHEEAAHVLGISRQTVANQMSAALRHVRSAVSADLDGVP